MALFGITIDRDDPAGAPGLTAVTFRSGAGAQDANVFILLVSPVACRLSTFDARPPACTEIEAEPHFWLRDNGRLILSGLRGPRHSRVSSQRKSTLSKRQADNYPLPGRDFHPLERAGFAWRTVW